MLEFGKRHYSPSNNEAEEQAAKKHRVNPISSVSSPSPSPSSSPFGYLAAKDVPLETKVQSLPLPFTIASATKQNQNTPISTYNPNDKWTALPVKNAYRTRIQVLHQSRHSLHEKLYRKYLYAYRDQGRHAVEAFNYALQYGIHEVIQGLHPVRWWDWVPNPKYDPNDPTCTQPSHVKKFYRYRQVNPRIGTSHQIYNSQGQARIVTSEQEQKAAHIHTAPLYVDVLSESGFLPDDLSSSSTSSTNSNQRPSTFRITPTISNSIQWQTDNVLKMTQVAQINVMRNSLIDVPVQLGIDNTNGDYSGTFEVASTIKNVPPLAKQAWNQDFIFPAKKTNKKYSFYYENRAQHESRPYHSTATDRAYISRATAKNQWQGLQIDVEVPYIDTYIPISVLYLAMNWRLETIPFTVCTASAGQWYAEFNKMCEQLILSCPCKTQEEALLFIAHLMMKKKNKMMLLKPEMADEEVIGEENKIEESKGDGKESKMESKGADTTMSDEQKLNYVRFTLDSELLPQLGSGPSSYLRKGEQLGYIIWSLFMVITGRMECDDRDDLAVKGFETISELIPGAIRQLHTQVSRQMTTRAMKCVEKGEPVPEWSKLFQEKKVTPALLRNFKTSTWCTSRTSRQRTNVVQAILHSGINALAVDTQMNKLSSTQAQVPNHPAARQIHPSSQRRYDPTETQEGKNCGLVNTKAVSCKLSMRTSPSDVWKFIHRFDKEIGFVSHQQWAEMIQKNGPFAFAEYYYVDVEGTSDGRVKFPERLADIIRKGRRCCCLPDDVEVYPQEKKQILYVKTCAGRLMAIALVADQYQRLKELDIDRLEIPEAIIGGLAEWLGPMEERVSNVAKDEADMIAKQKLGQVVTHIEIHEAMQLGIASSIINDMNSNQDPRNTFQDAMAKAAITQHLSAYVRAQKTRYSLMHAQKPLVATSLGEAFGDEFQCRGLNMVIGIMEFKGFTIEDAIVIRQGFVDLGGGVVMYHRTIRDMQRPTTTASQRVVYEKPKRGQCLGMKSANYDKINPETGMPDVGTALDSNDVMLGKTASLSIPLASLQGTTQEKKMLKATRRCASIVYRGERAIVTKAEATTNKQGLQVRTIELLSIRVPIRGNKFSSQHGQKGILALLFPDRDFPFNPVTGMPLDAIVNAISMGSRMTCGQMKEMKRAKAVALAGSDMADPLATPFVDQEESMEMEGEWLVHAGYQRNGCERLVDGQTGKEMDVPIFTGPIFYQVLKHMVPDKVHARGKGPISASNRQPMDGRSHEGGIRFGEMERDCIIAYGASMTLNEKLGRLSDYFTIFTCCNCGLFAICDFESKYTDCKQCQRQDTVVAIPTTFSTKTITQDLACLNMELRLFVEKTGEYLTVATRDPYMA